MFKANTKIDSKLYQYWSVARSHSSRILLVAGIAALVSTPSTALAQTTTVCGPEVKEEVVKTLASVENAPDAQKQSVQDELYKKFQGCAQDSKYVPSDFFVAARQCGAAVSNLGSLYYEEMSCTGYDPKWQSAPVKIKQVFARRRPAAGSRESFTGR
jgi:hypothetical protein